MNARAYKPGRAALLALGAGTSIACVCALGIAMIRNTVPGLWALAALAVAFVLCRSLAAVYAHLVTTVPSGAGMFAFVSRAWSPAAGMVAIAPYVMLMILLGALEALIVGHLLVRWVALPPLALAAIFLAASWAASAAGMRLGFRLQAVATVLLIGGMVMGSVWVLSQAASAPDLSGRLLAAPPTLAAFASAVGQAVFLFMGFELVCAQVEQSGSATVSWALKAIVWLLAFAYGLVILAMATVSLEVLNAAVLEASEPVALAVVALALLTSATSLNGAFLGLSRLIAVMGAQRVLPIALSRIHAPTLVPRAALAALLVACLASAAAIDAFDAFQAVILAAAVSAAMLYALAAWTRGRAPFATATAPLSHAQRAVRLVACVLLAAIAFGVLVDAGEHRQSVVTLLFLTYGAGALAALRLRLRSSPPRPGDATARSPAP